MKVQFPDFTGKILSIIAVGGETPCLLSEARFENQAGRLFLVGKVPTGGSRRDWLEGVSSLFAWDSVQEYMIYDSLEDYNGRLAIYRKKKSSKA